MNATTTPTLRTGNYVRIAPNSCRDSERDLRLLVDAVDGGAVTAHFLHNGKVVQVAAQALVLAGLDLSYDEHLEGCEAVHEGRAMDLMDCYLCPEGSPLRGVVSTYVTNTADPTEAYVLSCFHTVI